MGYKRLMFKSKMYKLMVAMVMEIIKQRKLWSVYKTIILIRAQGSFTESITDPKTITGVPLSLGSHYHWGPTITGVSLLLGSHYHGGPIIIGVPLSLGSHYHWGPTITPFQKQLLFLSCSLSHSTLTDYTAAMCVSEKIESGVYYMTSANDAQVKQRLLSFAMCCELRLGVAF